MEAEGQQRGQAASLNQHQKNAELHLAILVPPGISLHYSRQTYEAVDHLIEHSSQTPPVHRPVIRHLTKNLRGQILQVEVQAQRLRITQTLELISE